MSFRWFMGWLVTQIYIRTLCRVGLHWFIHYSERHKVTGIENMNITELDVPIRECECCGVRQHHLRPRHQGRTDWQRFNYEPEEEMKLTTNR